MIRFPECQMALGTWSTQKPTRKPSFWRPPKLRRRRQTSASSTWAESHSVAGHSSRPSGLYRMIHTPNGRGSGTPRRLGASEFLLNDPGEVLELLNDATTLSKLSF
jgi:hypothetical protein